MRRTQLVLPLLAAFGVACSGGETPVEPTPTERDGGASTTPDRDAGVTPRDGGSDVEEVPALACTRDSARIAARERCVSDLDCPCGAACSLGACVAACASDDECGEGTYCGRFGACVAALQVNDAPALDFTASGTLRVHPEVVVTNEALGARTITVRAEDHDVETIRVVAGAGLAVMCPGGSETGECTIDGLAAEASVEIQVVVTDALAAGDVRPVQLFAGRQRVEVSVTDDTALLDLLDSGTTQPLAGVYVGEARRLGLSPLTVPVSARLYDDGAQLVFQAEDPWNVFHRTGQLIGTTTVAAMGLDTVVATLAFPGVVYDDDTFHTETSAVMYVDEDRQMRFTVTFGKREFSADVTWQFVLRRAGGLTGAAPEVPETDPWLRRVGWNHEAGFRWVANSSVLRAAVAQSLYEGEARLDFCGAIPATVTNFVTSALFTGDAEGEGGYVGSSGNAIIDQVQGATHITDTTISYNSVGGGFSASEIVPCDVTFEDLSTTVAGVQVTLQLGHIDRCALIAERTGCVVHNLSNQGLLVRLRNIWTGGNTQTVGFGGTMHRGCEMQPALERRCAEALVCFPEGGTGIDSSQLTANVLTDPGRDLTCTSGTRAVAIDADLGTATAGELLDVCVAELAVIDVVEADASADGLEDPATCIAAKRHLAALQTFMDGADGGRRAAHRMMQQWLGLHAFLAREAGQQAGLPSAIVAPDPSDHTAAEVLSASLDGWYPVELQLFELLNDGTVLASPDYRAAYDPTAPPALPSDMQLEGLPVMVLDTLTAQLELADRLTDASQNDLSSTSLQLAGRALRWAGTMETMAESGVEAASQNGTPVWLQKYENAQASLRSVTARLSKKLVALGTGNNLLGVAEDDLPLYYFGDETTASQQFTAISDFLLGETFADLMAWSPQLVDQASDDLEDARTAYLAQADRQLQRTRDSREQELLEQDLKQQYGDELFNLCGAPSTLLGAELLEEWEDGHGAPFSPEDCYVKRDQSSCSRSFSVPTPSYVDLITAEDVAYQLCTTTEWLLDSLFGIQIPFVLGGKIDLSDEVLSAAMCARAGGTIAVAACGDDICFSCDGDQLRMTKAEIVELNNGFDVPLKQQVKKRLDCSARYPSAKSSLPSFDEVEDVDFDLPDCYRGALGEQALTIRAMAAEVEIARSELTELRDAYDIAIASCLILQEGNIALEEAQDAHNETMNDLRDVKLAADIVANVAGGAKDCASSVGSSPFAGGVACGAAAVEAAALSVSDGMADKMERAEQKHQTLMASIENDIDERTCFNDAELELVGVRTAMLRIEQTITELHAANLAFDNMKVAAQGIWDDGQSNLSFLEDRFVSPASHDYWFDERVQTYEKSFRLAKRITYLSVRSVEYELQQTLVDGRGQSLRDVTLVADSPSDLQAVLQELYSFAGVRSINGNRPTESKVVVSLRRHLLQLADASTRPDGWQSLTEAEKFQLVVRDPRYAMYGDDGDYLGQRIPFTVSPLGTLGLGDAQGIGVLAANSCAERIWAVNASILADGEYFVGDDPAFVNIDLLKRDTFYSQWCTTTGRDDPYQIASVRPSKNLFRDPVAGAAVGQTLLGVQSETSGYTRAQIEAVFNVPRDEFSSDDYANGETTQLGARGLYGEYALFIPSAIISRTVGATQTSGLDLSRIDDVLLRMDYVAVAR